MCVRGELTSEEEQKPHDDTNWCHDSRRGEAFLCSKGTTEGELLSRAHIFKFSVTWAINKCLHLKERGSSEVQTLPENRYQTTPAILRCLNHKHKIQSSECGFTWGESSNLYTWPIPEPERDLMLKLKHIFLLISKTASEQIRWKPSQYGPWNSRFPSNRLLLQESALKCDARRTIVFV